MSTIPGTVAGLPPALPVDDEAHQAAPPPYVTSAEILQAQAFLVGLTGCPADCAAEALRRVANDLGVQVGSVARRLLHNAVSAGADADSFVARVERTALATALQRRRSAAAPPLPLASAVPIVSGDLRGVTVTGEIDLATSWLLDRAVEASCPPVAETEPCPRSVFLLNLAGVTFLDASGIRAFTEAQDRAEASGYEVRVAAPMAAGPRRLLHLAVDRKWLDPVYRPPDDELGTRRSR